MGSWTSAVNDIPGSISCKSEGASVIQYKAGDRSHEPLQIEVNTVGNDGIRLATFKKQVKWRSVYYDRMERLFPHWVCQVKNGVTIQSRNQSHRAFNDGKRIFY